MQGITNDIGRSHKKRNKHDNIRFAPARYQMSGTTDYGTTKPPPPASEVGEWESETRPDRQI